MSRTAATVKPVQKSTASRSSLDLTIKMTTIRTMKRVNIADAKAHLSQHLARVEAGETIILCRRNVPIAELRPLPRPLEERRPVGVDPDLKVPDSFFESLPDDLLDAFEGRHPGS